MEGRKLRLSDLPEHILLYILSKLDDPKEVVRNSVLSTQWRYLWKSVPLSLDFSIFSRNRDEIAEPGSITRELFYWKSCQKIKEFQVFLQEYKVSDAKDVNLWLHFATQFASVESFTLEFDTYESDPMYELPRFAFKIRSLRQLRLYNCRLNLHPSDSINWSSLISLDIDLRLEDGVVEKILSGCPNLEVLAICRCVELHRLDISSVKLQKLFLRTDYYLDNAVDLGIFTPHLHILRIRGFFHKIHLKNVASLVTADVCLKFCVGDGEGNLERELLHLKKFLCCVAHAENLKLGPWCIESLCLLKLELEGSQFPPSIWKSLELNMDFKQLACLEFATFCRIYRISRH